MKFSLIIPAYNEEKRIKKTLKDYGEYFKRNFKNYEIIVICDGCTDRTPSIVERFSRENKHIKLLKFTQKLGKGGGISEGLKSATGDVLGFTDADEAVSPREFVKLIKKIENGVDCAIASRRVKGAKILSKQSFQRRIASKAFNLFVNFMFKLRLKDTQCGAKTFHRRVIRRVKRFKTSGFEFDVELLWKIKQYGFKIEEVPITWKHKEGTTFNLKYGPKMLVNLVKLRWFS
jgi:glycosyltransferase involved in cell wall biosynthesis